MKRRRIDVNLGELDQLLDQAQQTPLSEPDCNKIETTLHTLVEMLAAKRSTEKTSAVVGASGSEGAATEPAGAAERAWAQPGVGLHRSHQSGCAASEPEARRCVPGVPQGEGVRTKGSPAAGAHCGTIAVGRHGL